MSTTRGHYDRDGVDATRRSIFASRNRFWRTSDMDTAPSTTQRLLAELVAQGELRHIRKGLYWRGIKTPLGMALPTPDALATELVGRKGIGPAGLSAANALRLSTQIPRRAEYAVVGRPPTGGPMVHFVDRSARRGRAERALNSTEVAALEVLDGWDRVIETGPGEAMERLTGLITSGVIDPDRLAGASDTESGSARARLRHLLHRAGRADLADKMSAADPRVEAKALAGLIAA
jgi:hypothetical protein